MSLLSPHFFLETYMNLILYLTIGPLIILMWIGVIVLAFMAHKFIKEEMLNR